MPFGDILRSGNSPGTTPLGAGGSRKALYSADDTTETFYRHAIHDFSVIDSGAGPDGHATGIGGNTNRCYASASIGSKLYELSPTLLADVWQNVNSPIVNPYGIGGSDNRVWVCSSSVLTLVQVDPDDLTNVINTGSPPLVALPMGIGGDSQVIYHYQGLPGFRSFKLNPSDFSVIKYIDDAPGKLQDAQGLGGKIDVGWGVNELAQKLVEWQVDPWGGLFMMMNF